MNFVLSTLHFTNQKYLHLDPSQKSEVKLAVLSVTTGTFAGEKGFALELGCG